MTTPTTCPDTICTNCGKPEREHWHEDRVYCYGNTNGDLFTTEPTEEDKLREQIALLTAERDAAKKRAEAAEGKLAAAIEWANAERESWRDSNADRYWQMNRVVNILKPQGEQ